MGTITVDGVQLLKQTITQVKSEVTKYGKWSGLIVGNKVNPFHFVGGWHLAHRIDVSTIEEIDKYKTNFEYYLEKELGNRTVFYKLIPPN